MTGGGAPLTMTASCRGRRLVVDEKANQKSSELALGPIRQLADQDGPEGSQRLVKGGAPSLAGSHGGCVGEVRHREPASIELAHADVDPKIEP